MPNLTPPPGWSGVSASDQREIDRVPSLTWALRGRHYLWLQELRGPADLSSLLWGTSTFCHDCPYGVDCRCGYEPSCLFDLVILSGGPSPLHPQWARDLRDSCLAAGVGFAFTGWGERNPLGRTGGLDPDHYYPGRDPALTHRFKPGSQHVYRVGSAVSGRTLDGRTHDLPEGWRYE